MNLEMKPATAAHVAARERDCAAMDPIVVVVLPGSGACSLSPRYLDDVVNYSVSF